MESDIATSNATATAAAAITATTTTTITNSISKYSTFSTNRDSGFSDSILEDLCTHAASNNKSAALAAAIADDCSITIIKTTKVTTEVDRIAQHDECQTTIRNETGSTGVMDEFSTTLNINIHKSFEELLFDTSCIKQQQQHEHPANVPVADNTVKLTPLHNISNSNEWSQIIDDEQKLRIIHMKPTVMDYLIGLFYASGDNSFYYKNFIEKILSRCLDLLRYNKCKNLKDLNEKIKLEYLSFDKSADLEQKQCLIDNFILNFLNEKLLNEHVLLDIDLIENSRLDDEFSSLFNSNSKKIVEKQPEPEQQQQTEAAVVVNQIIINEEENGVDDVKQQQQQQQLPEQQQQDEQTLIKKKKKNFAQNFKDFFTFNKRRNKQQQQKNKNKDNLSKLSHHVDDNDSNMNNEQQAEQHKSTDTKKIEELIVMEIINNLVEETCKNNNEENQIVGEKEGAMMMMIIPLPLPPPPEVDLLVKEEDNNEITEKTEEKEEQQQEKKVNETTDPVAINNISCNSTNTSDLLLLNIDLKKMNSNNKEVILENTNHATEDTAANVTVDEPLKIEPVVLKEDLVDNVEKECVTTTATTLVVKEKSMKQKHFGNLRCLLCGGCSSSGAKADNYNPESIPIKQQKKDKKSKKKTTKNDVVATTTPIEVAAIKKDDEQQVPENKETACVEVAVPNTWAIGLDSSNEKKEERNCEIVTAECEANKEVKGEDVLQEQVKPVEETLTDESGIHEVTEQEVKPENVDADVKLDESGILNSEKQDDVDSTVNDNQRTAQAVAVTATDDEPKASQTKIETSKKSKATGDLANLLCVSSKKAKKDDTTIEEAVLVASAATNKQKQKKAKKNKKFKAKNNKKADEINESEEKEQETPQEVVEVNTIEPCIDTATAETNESAKNKVEELNDAEQVKEDAAVQVLSSVEQENAKETDELIHTPAPTPEVTDDDNVNQELLDLALVELAEEIIDKIEENSQKIVLAEEQVVQNASVIVGSSKTIEEATENMSSSLNETQKETKIKTRRSFNLSSLLCGSLRRKTKTDSTETIPIRSKKQKSKKSKNKINQVDNAANTSEAMQQQQQDSKTESVVHEANVKTASSSNNNNSASFNWAVGLDGGSSENKETKVDNKADSTLNEPVISEEQPLDEVKVETADVTEPVVDDVKIENTNEATEKIHDEVKTEQPFNLDGLNVEEKNDLSDVTNEEVKIEVAETKDLTNAVNGDVKIEEPLNLESLNVEKINNENEIANDEAKFEEFLNLQPAKIEENDASEVVASESQVNKEIKVEEQPAVQLQAVENATHNEELAQQPAPATTKQKRSFAFSSLLCGKNKSKQNANLETKAPKTKKKKAKASKVTVDTAIENIRVNDQTDQQAESTPHENKATDVVVASTWATGLDGNASNNLNQEIQVDDSEIKVKDIEEVEVTIEQPFKLESVNVEQNNDLNVAAREEEAKLEEPSSLEAVKVEDKHAMDEPILVEPQINQDIQEVEAPALVQEVVETATITEVSKETTATQPTTSTKQKGPSIFSQLLCGRKKNEEVSTVTQAKIPKTKKKKEKKSKQTVDIQTEKVEPKLETNQQPESALTENKIPEVVVPSAWATGLDGNASNVIVKEELVQETPNSDLEIKGEAPQEESEELLKNSENHDSKEEVAVEHKIQEVLNLEASNVNVEETKNVAETVTNESKIEESLNSEAVKVEKPETNEEAVNESEVNDQVKLEEQPIQEVVVDSAAANEKLNEAISSPTPTPTTTTKPKSSFVFSHLLCGRSKNKDVNLEPKAPKTKKKKAKAESKATVDSAIEDIRVNDQTDQQAESTPNENKATDVVVASTWATGLDGNASNETKQEAIQEKPNNELEIKVDASQEAEVKIEPKDSEASGNECKAESSDVTNVKEEANFVPVKEENIILSEIKTEPVEHVEVVETVQLEKEVKTGDVVKHEVINNDVTLESKISTDFKVDESLPVVQDTLVSEKPEAVEVPITESTQPKKTRSFALDFLLCGSKKNKNETKKEKPKQKKKKTEVVKVEKAIEVKKEECQPVNATENANKPTASVSSAWATGLDSVSTENKETFKETTNGPLENVLELKEAKDEPEVVIVEEKEEIKTESNIPIDEPLQVNTTTITDENEKDSTYVTPVECVEVDYSKEAQDEEKKNVDVTPTVEENVQVENLTETANKENETAVVVQSIETAIKVEELQVVQQPVINEVQEQPPKAHHAFSLSSLLCGRKSATKPEKTVKTKNKKNKTTSSDVKNVDAEAEGLLKPEINETQLTTTTTTDVQIYVPPPTYTWATGLDDKNTVKTQVEEVAGENFDTKKETVHVEESKLIESDKTEHVVAVELPNISSEQFKTNAAEKAAEQEANEDVEEKLNYAVVELAEKIADDAIDLIESPKHTQEVKETTTTTSQTLKDETSGNIDDTKKQQQQQQKHSLSLSHFLCGTLRSKSKTKTETETTKCEKSKKNKKNKSKNVDEVVNEVNDKTAIEQNANIASEPLPLNNNTTDTNQDPIVKSDIDANFVEYNCFLTWYEANAKARQLFFEGRRTLIRYNDTANKFTLFVN